MRPPTPRSLLVEHPALPRPLTSSESEHSTVRISELHDHDRYRIAVQLLSVTALLADFELWPGRWALRRSVVKETTDGLRVRLPALPAPLSRIWSKLGGGDPAAETTRSAVLSTIAEVTGLDPGVFEQGGREPGFFLDGVLMRLLDELDRPLDVATARSLWMWRWELPEQVQIGDTTLLAVSDELVARRLGAAMWAEASRRGEATTFEIVFPDRKPVRVAGPGDTGRIRIFAGAYDDQNLASILDRTGNRDVATVVLGRFPEGWDSVPAPVFDIQRPAIHLTLTGLSPARKLRFVDRQAGRFDPFSQADRQSLTQSAAWLFSESHRRRPRRFSELASAAGLAPEGVPIERFLELAAVDEMELNAACKEGVVVYRWGRVMAPQPVLMTVDPRHAELVGLYDLDDPRRLLHEALASGNPGSLLDWARGRLDDLDFAAVRCLLTGLADGALGPGPQVALAHSCLSLADIHGARRALSGLNDEIARPWSNWLRLMDRAPEFEVEIPRPIEVRHAPRACAEIALVSLRRALRWGSGSAQAPMEMLREALLRLDGMERRWVEIRRAALVEPELLDDGNWRREATDGHPELIGLVVFERSLRAMFEGRSRLAKRLLRRVMSAERAPGRRAIMQVNLGALEADDGRHQVAEALTLGAFRLFQAAGSRHRVWDVLFNLAVADIDQLRVDRAASRLDQVAASQNSLFVEVERARLALAVGDLDLFRSRLLGLPEVEELSSLPIVQALSFLYGVQALFYDSAESASLMLQAGGREGLAWLELADAVAGRPSRGIESKYDGWGIRKAAALVRSLREADSLIDLEVDDREPVDLGDALAVALCRTLAIRPGWPGRRLRYRAAEVLARSGLSGWAARIRWGTTEVEDLLRGLSKLVRCLLSDRSDQTGIEDVFGVLGIQGLIVVSALSGRELWRAGAGEPCTRHTRGAIELVPLGSEPVQGPVWDLLGDLFGFTLSTDGEPSPKGHGSEVRVDGISPAATRLREEVVQAAGPRFTVLIHGETGSGKEVVAREIHRLSGRTGEMVPVNIAAVPGNLLEAELFGSVRGAFTGAERSREGLVTAADGGSLFLDEVGDLDIALQVKLLRFLESREVRPVGSDRTRTLDVRVICATHRNLDRRVREGRFREDLYYRIALATVEVPPLRERIEDIPILRSIFEEEAARSHGLRVAPWTPAAEMRLMKHRWPGNIRELKSTVEVAMARASGGTIRPEHLPLGEPRPMLRGSWANALAGFKRSLLTEVLNRNRGNRSAAARELGISRQALLYQLKKLKLTEL